MSQLALFDAGTSDTPAPVARRSDPETSHAAADVLDLTELQQEVVRVLRIFRPDPLTAEEIAELCCRVHRHRNAATYRKRVHELGRDPLNVLNRCGKRHCNATKSRTKSMTFQLRAGL